MANLILFDNPQERLNLLPLTFTRPMADLRLGITTLRQKWQQLLGCESSSTLTADYLSEKYPLIPLPDDNLFVAGNVVASPLLADAVKALKSGEALVDESERLIAVNSSLEGFRSGDWQIVKFPAKAQAIVNLYDIFGFNGDAITADYALCDLSDSQSLSPTNTVIGPTRDQNGRPLIYVAPGAKCEGAMLNTSHGPIYIAPDAEVMEGSCLRGPVAVCQHATVNMGTKIYPATTIGPWSKVGGELNNVVIIGYSNKAHDGFLGNAVIGEWCNLGAGCVASNLKNDYTPIKLWNYPASRFLKTGLQFCGLIMGDHSKAGINTMFNTATVVGVGVNVHGSGFPRNFIASFQEGGASGFSDVSLTKFFDIAERVMARRGLTLSEVDRRIFTTIHSFADNYK